MRNHNFILISIALFLILPSCMGTRVRDNVLLPVMQSVWPKIHENIERGLMDAISKEEITLEDSSFIIFEFMNTAMQSGIREEIISIPYHILEPYGHRGIQVMIDEGELTIQTAEFLFERLKNFKYALDTLKKDIVYLPGPTKREYCSITDKGTLYYGTKKPTLTVSY